MKAIQLYYPPEWAHCYGCGYLNPMGLHLKTYWKADEGQSETPVSYTHLTLPTTPYV